MTEAKIHHYVPQFYLKYFLDVKKKLWVYDKNTDKVFNATSRNIAAEKHFYRLPDFIFGEKDPLSIERNLSRIEDKASGIIAHIISETGALAPMKKITISDDERVVMSEFMATQYFRTLELRDLMLYLLEDTGIIENELDSEEKKAVYFYILSCSGFFEEFAESLYKAIWIFANNNSNSPFITSDHPVCISSNDSKMWLKGVGALTDGMYLVFPISPTLILYCKEFNFWSKLQNFDLKISPVTFTSDMVQHENCGQAFMASRFLISSNSDFKRVRDFIPSIGTDTYAPKGFADSEAVQRAAVFNNKRRAIAKG